MNPIEIIDYRDFHIKVFHDEVLDDPWETKEMISQRFYSKHLLDSPGKLFDHFGSNGAYMECSLDNQKDWVYLFISLEKLVDAYGKLPGAVLKPIGTGILKKHGKLYQDWAKGLVYGYVIEHEMLDDSGWGFFGMNHEKSGMMEVAKKAIDHAIRWNKKKEVAA